MSLEELNTDNGFWNGKMIDVDLSSESIDIRRIPSEMARKYIGGRGFNSKIIYDEFDPSLDDWKDSDNLLVISPGTLVGAIPNASRTTVSVRKSPITGLFGDSNLGGHFGSQLRWAGYDTIIVRGKADNPVYLTIYNDEVRLRDAKKLEGEDVFQTDKYVKQTLDNPNARSLVIGPAGENLVTMANVLGDTSRAAGKSGTGAVWGSKNLKAIGAVGTKGIEPINPEKLLEVYQELYESLVTGPLFESFSKFGSPVLVDVLGEGGAMPTYNWQQKPVETKEVDAESFLKKFAVKDKACSGCPLHCGHLYKIEEGPYEGTTGSGIEYESFNGFGPRSGNVEDLDAIVYLNNLCNQMGLDTIETSNVIGTLMHWLQDGLIDYSDIDGIDLNWGNTEGMEKIIKKLANREGIGDVLAENIFSTSEYFADKKDLDDQKLKKYIIHTKKMTYPSGDMRAEKGAALSYAVSTRGGDHLRGLNTETWLLHDDPEDMIGIPNERAKDFLELGLNERGHNKDKGYAVKHFEANNAVCDSLGVCKRHSPWEGQRIGLEAMAKYISAFTGTQIEWKELEECGNRIFTLERYLQVKDGVTREDDYPPDRWMEEPLASGPYEGELIDRDDYEEMLDQYYEYRGYNEKGIPKEETLQELGIK